MGPVDYLVVKFQGNKFSGKIIPELVNLQRRDIIRILDFVLVQKDAKGMISITEAKDLEDHLKDQTSALAEYLKGQAGALTELAKDTGEWFYEGDINSLAAELQNNSTAGILLVENVWAIRFKEALLDADAELVDMGRIPPETIAKVEKALMAQGGT